MWVLLFVVATSSDYKVGAASIQQEFTSRENCMVAQTTLINQAKSRGNYILVNACTPK